MTTSYDTLVTVGLYALGVGYALVLLVVVRGMVTMRKERGK